MLMFLYLSETSLDVLGVSYQAQCSKNQKLAPYHHRGSTRLNSPLLTCRGPWIHEVVSISVHVHLPETIGNETRQTRQHVSSHQQTNGGVGEPRRDIKLCAVQSTTVHERHFDSESQYQ
ncbi:hypothetical protein AVEN_202009-1 [Araneus ventricosus]|uniref:Uncharacterized protein n=1 Tax=Araneus ventricosus TaxID=182803 RepID=A0A4Y2QAT6_ARAVE|nr:hypothetical protein AVEN_202009-1 [Araneus ventricosus]